MERRFFISALAGGIILPYSGWASSSPRSNGESYRDFCELVRREAQKKGVSKGILDKAFLCTGIPNQDVLKRDRHQPEFTLSWSQYRDRVVRPERCKKGAQHYQDIRYNMNTICKRFGSDSSVVMGIWGIESGFGITQGSFNVIDALATLAFDGRRSSYFRQELLKALVILEQGNIAPDQMLGSYAGAMGQVQFMPSAYLRFAADGNGDGKKDIWNNQADIFASTANYLAKNGWKPGEPWGEEVTIPLGKGEGLSATKSRHAPLRSVSEWRSEGVKAIDGSLHVSSTTPAKLLQPDGAGGQAFLVYHNFQVIRSYNPSDYYALAVGLLGDRIVTL